MAVSRRVRGGLLGAAVAGSLVLGATGCAGGADEPATGADEAVAAGRLCGGKAVSTGAGEALEVITGSSEFAASGERSTVAHAAQELADRFASSATATGDVCRVHTADGTSGDELRITWRLSGSAPVDDPAEKFTVLKMGERALTAPDGAFLRFGCRGGKLPGSGPAHIDIGVERGGMPTDPEGDPGALRDAYATVAHSFSLAMAKALGCEDDGGLEARPALDPA
ncbi:hypothetical protein ABZ172_19215 [Streptomyces sp. NPDC006296]|uniref:hypothetical protein n=1 Tax=Streptomyces sp. NPDC006296 TaxID=3156746 RepID=UPI0033A4F045